MRLKLSRSRNSSAIISLLRLDSLSSRVELLCEQAPIRQRRQAVVVGQLAQPVLGFGNLLDRLVELLIAPGQLRGAFLDLHAK